MTPITPSQAAPSPASTYGQTLVGGDSVPPTPGSDLINESCETSGSYDVIDRNDEAHDQFDDAPPYKFEVLLDRCKNASAAVRRGLSLSTCGSSPAKLASMVQDLPVNRLARSNSCFVRGIDDDNDVFGLGNAELATITTPEEHSVDGSDTKSTNEASNLSPRADRQGHKVTADNAQAHYKPECCIFVANLPSTRPDDVIRNALNDVYARFGKCFIKLKRDRGMPIAFIQYDNAEDASKALGQGAGVFVLGRKARTERAKAPRCVYVSRRDGKIPTEDEVMDLISSRGEIEKTWAASDTDQEVHKLPPGFFVRFTYYQDAVDAINALRDIPMYNVEAQHTPKSAISFFDSSSIMTKPPPNARAPLFDPSQHDSRALWIGELPDTVTKSDLARVFGGPGRQIRYIELRIRSSTDRAEFMSYAFIHYLEPRAAHMAARMTYGTLRLFNRRPVKVQYARKPHWQLVGNATASTYSQNVVNQSMVPQNVVSQSMVPQNMSLAMSGFTTTPQTYDMRQLVPAFGAQQPLAVLPFYGPSLYGENPQADFLYNPELGYNMAYMTSDMNTLSVVYPYQFQDMSGNSYMYLQPYPQPQMSVVAPSYIPDPRFYCVQ
ncbi:uncharacterized protein J3D65DRAFT_667944 [Phyllosticta citribraziliensis]|uniref:RRM domain-containing protein n=1 Tax=Phyllosticta citribraziliensis TaxID=989973 RepID=A0ABR1LTB5_9PEZI